ncbi:MAG: hypothetical protein ACKVOW_19870 [Chitinophagaceae bacterium]
MKQNILILAVLFIIAENATAQSTVNRIKKTNFWTGAQASIAAADLAKTHSAGVGIHAQVTHRIAPKTELLGSVRYNYFFGKKMDGYSEPGSGMSYGAGKFKGMNDIGITGGARQYFGNNIFVDAEAGVCLGFSDGLSNSSVLGLVKVGKIFGLNSPNVQAIALFFGLCGDPKIQVGVTYSIRL